MNEQKAFLVDNNIFEAFFVHFSYKDLIFLTHCLERISSEDFNLMLKNESFKSKTLELFNVLTPRAKKLLVETVLSGDVFKDKINILKNKDYDFSGVINLIINKKESFLNELEQLFSINPTPFETTDFISALFENNRLDIICSKFSSCFKQMKINNIKQISKDRSFEIIEKFSLEKSIISNYFLLLNKISLNKNELFLHYKRFKFIYAGNILPENISSFFEEKILTYYLDLEDLNSLIEMNCGYKILNKYMYFNYDDYKYNVALLNLSFNENYSFKNHSFKKMCHFLNMVYNNSDKNIFYRNAFFQSIKKVFDEKYDNMGGQILSLLIECFNKPMNANERDLFYSFIEEKFSLLSQVNKKEIKETKVL